MAVITFYSRTFSKDGGQPLMETSLVTVRLPYCIPRLYLLLGRISSRRLVLELPVVHAVFTNSLLRLLYLLLLVVPALA